MTRADVAAAIRWIGATLYALFGGADFGAGFWDLVAGGAQRGERPRGLIQSSLTPVWEANHVWLIFILVVLWTGFPDAFGAVMSTLYVPLALAALGIVLRGAGFAFRKSIRRLGARRAMGATFALSSVLTPFFMGTVAGAIAAGNVPAQGNGDAFASWTGPLPLLVGALFVASGAYLAAVFLVGDARRAGGREAALAARSGDPATPALPNPDLETYFSRRALGAALVAGAFAAAGLVALHAEARYLFDRLTDQGLPLVILSALCGLGVLLSLLRGWRRPLRPLAAGAVVAVVWGWGVAQAPYLLPTSLKITESAAPPDTLAAILAVFIAAAVIVLPALGLLYWLSQRELLND
ncbi:MAG TPA: cytochrome d ubiquinol oxidase subunit II [Solirubrobacterales bacterium]|nr:cytochrome d ubiquinol oxidase subunit II [Solirubrobacterales bacterium]